MPEIIESEPFREQPVLLFPTVQTWVDWLEQHHAEQGGIWMRFAKKGASYTSISYVEAREGALCYGWIDGQIYKYDAESYLTRFTQRRPKSVWSQVNVALVEDYIERGMMRPSGMAQVTAAQQDGRWAAAYAPPSSIEMSPDLAEALAANQVAGERYQALPKSARYSILYRLHNLKTPASRAKCIAQFVEQLTQA
jgi:uncharacterized protein YdeI (YjbR/CyaY-like superfamily)